LTRDADVAEGLEERSMAVFALGPDARENHSTE
jgi:hypothetical protein